MSDGKDGRDPLLQTTPQATALTRGLSRAKQERVALLVHAASGLRVVGLADGQKLVVGRDPSAGLFVDDASLSRRHARFSRVGETVWVEDLGSTNGTSLYGRRLEREERLEAGQDVLLGQVAITLHVPGMASRRGAGGVEPHDVFHDALVREVVRAHAFGRCFALLLVEPQSAAAIGQLRGHLRAVDRFAVFSPEIVEILLPEADPDAAAVIARGLLSAPRLVKRCAVVAYPDAGTSADELVQEALTALKCRSVPKSRLVVAEGAAAAVDGGQTSTDEGAGAIVASPAMHALHQTIERLAGTVVPVLLLGETGAGKEVLARAIHEVDARRAARLVSINCGAIPPTLLESVLFGHERGAFSGATQTRVGLFEQANGGTLFLDEIGELSASAQAALLRVLETRKITRVGGHEERLVDVRVVAATHRDLETMSERGEFRQDLLFRINTMTLVIPPLRDRPEELEALAVRFIAAANRANGCTVSGLAPPALRLLFAYTWPGNVRELRNVLERAVIIAHDRAIELSELPERLRAARRATSMPGSPSPTPTMDPDGMEQPEASGDLPPETRSPAAAALPIDLRERLAQVEVELILSALEQTGGRRSEAARLLSLPVRTLSHKMRQLGVRKLGYGK